MHVPEDSPEVPSTTKDICLGMLAYEGGETIKKTMKTWKDSGMLDAVGERIMYIQGPPKADWNKWLKGMAAHYNFEVIEAATNTMFDALFQLNLACKGKYFMFLEEDWTIEHADKTQTIQQLTAGVKALATGMVHGVRYRHVRFYGEPNWALQTWHFNSRKNGGNPGAGAALQSRSLWGDKVKFGQYPCPDCYILRDLGDDPPRPVTVQGGPECQVWKCQEDPIMYCVRTAAYDDWYKPGMGKKKYVFYTNNPMLWEKKWFDRWREVGARGGAAKTSFEPTVQNSPEWNNPPGYIISRGMGLFTHARKDRGKTVPSDPVPG